MIYIDKCVAFSGHRDLSKVDLNELQKRIESEVIHSIMNGYRDFITGCALGFDQLVFFTINNIKNRPEFVNLGIKNILAVPFVGFGSKWSLSNKEVFKNMLHLCDEFYIVDQIPAYYSNHYYTKLQNRNKFMIDYSNKLVVFMYPNTFKGGTYNAVAYCNLMNKPYILI